MSKLKNREVVTELKRISNVNGGVLRPRQVVDAARSKKSPLHNFFTWENTRAAEQWRLHEARMLIAVTVEYAGTESNGLETRVFVSLKSERGKGYRPIVDVLTNEGLRQQLLQDALEVMSFYRKKYSELKELSAVFAAIEEVESKLRGRSKRKKAA